MSSIYQRNGVWQIQFKANGQNIQKSLRTTDRKAAIRMQAEIDAAVTPENTPLEAPHTVAGLIVAYLRWADTYYRKGGKLTTHYHKMEIAFRYLDSWGDLEIDAFGPRALREYQSLLAQTMVRDTCNAFVSIVRGMFKWAVAQEYAKADTWKKLDAVAMLAAGRSAVRESKDILPAPEGDIEAVRVIASQWVRDCIDLQLLTAARPGELFLLTPGCIDRTGDVWVATIAGHKTEHKGKSRHLYFGPKAQSIIVRYLFGRRQDQPLMGGHSRNGYAKNISALCRRAGVDHWHPNQLRHNAATRIRAAHDIDVAQVLLGHSSADTTQIYAEVNADKAKATMAKIG